MGRIMGYRENIPPDLLEKFDEIGWESVESNIKLGLYREKNETKAKLYVDHFKAERDASRSSRQEARAEETLSVAPTCRGCSPFGRSWRTPRPTP